MMQTSDAGERDDVPQVSSGDSARRGIGVSFSRPKWVRLLAARENRPQRAVERAESWPFSPMLKAAQLMPQSEVLGDKVSPVCADGHDDGDDQRDFDGHTHDAGLDSVEAVNEELRPRRE